MGFLDKAKAAATDLAAKADTALNQSGLAGNTATNSKMSESQLRDLGVVAYLNATGRTVPPGEEERLVGALSAQEQQGELRTFAMATATPPPPGSIASGQAAPPPPMSSAGPASAGPPPPPPPPPGMAAATPPPPPPAPSAVPPVTPMAPASANPPAPAPGITPPPPPPPGFDGA